MSSAAFPPPSPGDEWGGAPLPTPMPVAPERRRNGERRQNDASTKRFSWGRSTIRERRLGARLDRELAPIGAVLHGRRLLDGTHRIDHLVVAPTGIWTVLADHTSGSVSASGRGDTQRVHLGDVDQQPWIDSAAMVAERVRQALVPIGFDWVDVSPTLCFTNARWGMVAREIEIDGVCVTWGKALVDRIATPGPLLVKDARVIADALATQLVVDRAPSGRRAEK